MIRILMTFFCVFLAFAANSVQAQNTYYNSKSGTQSQYGSQNSGAAYIAQSRNGRSSGSQYSSTPLNLRQYTNPNYKPTTQGNQAASISPYTGAKPSIVRSPYARTPEELSLERERITAEIELQRRQNKERYEQMLQRNSELLDLENKARELDLAKNDPVTAYALGIGEDADLSDRIDELLEDIESVDGQGQKRPQFNTGVPNNESSSGEKRRKLIYNKQSNSANSYTRRSINIGQ